MVNFSQILNGKAGRKRRQGRKCQEMRGRKGKKGIKVLAVDFMSVQHLVQKDFLHSASISFP